MRRIAPSLLVDIPTRRGDNVAFDSLGGHSSEFLTRHERDLNVDAPIQQGYRWYLKLRQGRRRSYKSGTSLTFCDTSATLWIESRCWDQGYC